MGGMEWVRSSNLPAIDFKKAPFYKIEISLTLKRKKEK